MLAAMALAAQVTVGSVVTQEMVRSTNYGTEPVYVGFYDKAGKNFFCQTVPAGGGNELSLDFLPNDLLDAIRDHRYVSAGTYQKACHDRPSQTQR